MQFHPLVALSILFTTGCGAFAGTAAESAVEGGLEAAAQQEQQRQIASVLADPHIQRATGDMVASILDAAINAVTREERAAAFEDALARYTAVVGTELGSNITRSITQELEGVLDAQRMAPNQLDTLSASMAEGITRGLATGLREDVGPAVREVIREDVAVALEEALDERLQAALGRAARTMAHEAVIGATQAMQAEGRGGGGVRSDFRGFLEQGESAAQWAVVAVVLLVVFALIALIVLAIAARRARRDARTTRSQLDTMVSAIQGTEDRAWSSELRGILREAYSGRDSPELLRSILREDPSLRSRVREAAERVEAKGGPHESPA